MQSWIEPVIMTTRALVVLNTVKTVSNDRRMRFDPDNKQYYFNTERFQR